MQIAIVREDEDERDIREEIAKVKNKLKAFNIIELGKTVEYFHNPGYTVTYGLIKYKGKLYTTENRNLREWEEGRDRIVAVTSVYPGRKMYDDVKEKYGIDVHLGATSKLEVHQERVV